MEYYKIIKSGSVVAVLSDPVWVTQSRSGAILRCGLSRAIGVISPDASCIWHISGAKSFTGENEYEDIDAIYIEETEAKELLTLLDLGASVSEDNSSVEWDVDEPAAESPDEDLTLSEVKSKKLIKLSEQSRKEIADGVSVELSDGRTEHFLLGIEEQLDLITLYSLVNEGSQNLPFRDSDGKCSYYSADDVLRIIKAATNLKMYHAAYLECIQAWVNSMQSISDIGAVSYGDSIPEEYRTELYLSIVESD